MDPKVEAFRQRCLEDSGFLCRNLLGWNYDMDESTGEIHNVGSGGVRGHGPDKLMTDFLDAKGKRFKLMLAPRGTRKSTKLGGYCVRRILQNGNIRILYGMLDKEKAENKAKSIRASLMSKKIVDLFGQHLVAEAPADGFTVLTRTRRNLAEPTLTTFTTSVPATSGHFDVVIVDDPIDEKWGSEAMLTRARTSLRQVFPLLESGGVFILTGTRYFDDDVFHDALVESRWDKLVLDSGDDIEIVQRGDNAYEVVGTPRFPHQSLEYLNDALAMMGPRVFLAQYMNRIQADVRDMFTREMFQPIRWNNDMKLLSGYLLTDTATSQVESGCYSVLAYVGLDQQHNVYLLDLRVGKWHPSELVDTFFDLLHLWRPKVNHIMETLEHNDATNQLMGHIHYVSRVRGLKHNITKVKRIGNKDRKDVRIRALQPVMAQKRFFVCDTVPRTFTDLTGEKLLFDPEGWKDEKSGTALPDGELVHQFIKFGTTTRKDIADCLADIEAVDRQNGDARYCVFKPPRSETAWSLVEDRKARVQQILVDQPQAVTSTEDFWTRIARENGVG